MQTFEDTNISGAKGRDQRPAFDRMLKDAVRRKFDVLMAWSIGRLGRSVLHVATAMAEMDAAGVPLYSDQQAIDSTSPFGKPMIQMACVFGELDRETIRARACLLRYPGLGMGPAEQPPEAMIAFVAIRPGVAPAQPRGTQQGRGQQCEQDHGN